MKYVANSNCTFAYDPKIKFLIKVDNTKHLVSLIKMINPTLAGDKALATDLSGNILFVNTDEFEVTAFGKLEGETPTELFKIDNISNGIKVGDSKLTDIKCVSKNKFVTLTSDGKLSLYLYSANEYKLIKEHDLSTARNRPSNEQFVSIGADSTFKSGLIAVSTEVDSSVKKVLSRILLLDISDTGSFSVLGAHLFSN